MCNVKKIIFNKFVMFYISRMSKFDCIFYLKSYIYVNIMLEINIKF